jgi:hypothetical protein
MPAFGILREASYGKEDPVACGCTQQLCASFHRCSDHGLTIFAAPRERLSSRWVYYRLSEGFPEVRAFLSPRILPSGEITYYVADTWERKIVTCRVIVGMSTILAGLFSIGSHKPIYDATGNTTGCLMWRLILSKSQCQ